MKIIKKVIQIALAVFVINICFTQVHAKNPTEINVSQNTRYTYLGDGKIYDRDFNDIVDINDDTSLANLLISRDTAKQASLKNIPFPLAASAYVTQQAWATNGLQHYFQNDSRWASSIMKTCGSSIGSKGCALTSFSMIMTFNYRSSDTPLETNSKLGAYACPFNYSQAANRYNVNSHQLAHSPQMEATAKSLIRGALIGGNPVMVGMHSTNSSNTHFVVVYGYEFYSDGGSYYYIFHPSSYTNNSHLDQYMANYYIERVYTFY